MIQEMAPGRGRAKFYDLAKKLNRRYRFVNPSLK